MRLIIHHASFIISVRVRLGTLALLCLCLPGCGGCSDGIDARYGRRSGAGARASVNGTAVLGEMFERAGHRVMTAVALSPKVRQRADVIIWFPDDFQAPSPAACRWLDEWLDEWPGRTLVYVGRDFDAAGFYWKKVLPTAPAGQQNEVARRAREADREFLARRGALPGTPECDFFRLEAWPGARKMQTLQGDPFWTEDVDPAAAEIELSGRVAPPLDAEILLRSGEDAIVSRQYRGQGQVIVVANGSFLLNLSLVNHEHRKLAGRLIAETGAPRQDVVFLESGPGGPRILDKDPAMRVPTGMEVFHEWPANWILLHVSLLGILFCFWRWPVFGRARDPAPEGLTDFGRHVEALGELLEHTRDRAYAMTRLLHYQQSMKGKE